MAKATTRDQAVRWREDFGRRVRDARMESGISQGQLADLSGLHRTYISSVERGKRNICLANIRTLADSLEVEAGRLLGDAEPGPRPKRPR